MVIAYSLCYTLTRPSNVNTFSVVSIKDDHRSNHQPQRKQTWHNPISPWDLDPKSTHLNNILEIITKSNDCQ